MFCTFWWALSSHHYLCFILYSNVPVLLLHSVLNLQLLLISCYKLRFDITASNSCIATPFSSLSWHVSWAAPCLLSSLAPTYSSFCILTWSGSFSSILEHLLPYSGHLHCSWAFPQLICASLMFASALFSQLFFCSCLFKISNSLFFVVSINVFCASSDSTLLPQANTCSLEIYLFDCSQLSKRFYHHTIIIYAIHEKLF